MKLGFESVACHCRLREEQLEQVHGPYPLHLPTHIMPGQHAQAFVENGVSSLFGSGR